MINNIKNSRIHINTNDIQILDFNKDWKVIRTFYIIGQASTMTIYSKEESDNMDLLYAEYKENKKIILVGKTDKEYIIKRLTTNGYVSDIHKWDISNGVKSSIYRIGEGIYGINIYNGFQIWSEYEGITQNTVSSFKKIFTRNLHILDSRAKTKIGVKKEKYFDVYISYGSTDTLHARCSLELESKLKYFPYIASERIQNVIKLSDEMLYLEELLKKFKNTPYAEELANAIREDMEEQDKKATNAKRLLLTKIKDINLK